VVVDGPTTMAAIRNSPRMGFRASAIDKRLSAVCSVLSGVTSEFCRFGSAAENSQSNDEHFLYEMRQRTLSVGLHNVMVGSRNHIISELFKR
jgi:DNA anti-recombination protein RmuC